MGPVALVADAASRLNRLEQTTFGQSPLTSLIESCYGRADAPARAAVLFIATERRAGVSWTASAVTAELARNGRSVLLVDAVALMAASTEEEALARCRRAEHSKAWMLSGPGVRRAESALAKEGQRMGAILEALLQEFEHIVLDAPALSVSDLALKLAPLVAGSIFVVRADQTERRPLIKACELFGALGGRVLGCAYNEGMRQG